ncbi:MAG: hypothetical protein ACOX0X_01010 [Candidatus Dojkabacteria bacterium]
MDNENYEVKTRLDSENTDASDKRSIAIQELKNLKFLVPMSEMELFHGRASDGSTEWKVDPGYETENTSTVFKLPVLHTGSRELASAFASARHTDKKKSEIHEIMSYDPNVYIVNLLTKRDDETKRKINECFKDLTIHHSVGSPIPFKYRKSAKPLLQALYKKKYLTFDQIEEFSQNNRFSDLTKQEVYGLSKQVVGSGISRYALENNPGYAFLLFLEQSDHYPAPNGKFPFDSDYIRRFCREYKIVGVTIGIHSGTLHKDIESTAIFDMGMVNKRELVEKSRINQREIMKRKFGAIAPYLPKEMLGIPNLKNERFLYELKRNYGRPYKIIQSAKRIGGYKEHFEKKIGVWEGFTLEEHTETVLRNFEESFGDIIPVELLAPMRLAILVHDIGKPIAREGGHINKFREQQLNNAYAKQFLEELQVDDKLKRLILTVIGEGSAAIHDKLVNKIPDNQTGIYDIATKAAIDFFDKERPSKSEVYSIISMFYVLYYCDGGAYTSKATTLLRDSKGEGIFLIWNYGSFDKSFDLSKNSWDRTIYRDKR